MASKKPAAKVATPVAKAATKTAEKAPFVPQSAKPSPAKPLKVGTKVSFTRRNGETQQGVVAGLPEARGQGTSAFVPVNVGDKKLPEITRRRQSELTVI